MQQTKKNLNQFNPVMVQAHPFHLVTVSPWPFITSCSAFTAAIGLVFLMHLDNYSSSAYLNHMGLILLHAGLFGLCLTLYRWFTDIVTEATFEGHHTVKVQQGLRYGVVLFIVSEIMFFFGFFWTFFHSSLSPAVSIGCVWPPKGIEVIKPFELPFLNTLILLSSGVSITWAHRAIFAGNRRDTIIALAVTVSLGIIFTGCQAFEYYTAPFSINDGIYGSIFYLTTGFHGFHVLVGTIFLMTNLWRQIQYHFTRQHHFGFEAGAWYWHFVDVVWIFLFITLYWWGS